MADIICHIQYQLDPFQRDKFERYARTWLSVIPECGGDLLGYFMPHEGSNDMAHAMIGFASLAAYEAYRTKLTQHAGAMANFEFAQSNRLILRERREFLRKVNL